MYTDREAMALSASAATAASLRRELLLNTDHLQQLCAEEREARKGAQHELLEALQLVKQAQTMAANGRREVAELRQRQTEEEKAVEGGGSVQEPGRQSTLVGYHSLRSPSRASSALAHYTGRESGSFAPATQRTSGTGRTLQQFRTQGQQQKQQRYESVVDAQGSWGAVSAVASFGDRLSNPASVAWHHRLAQGRRSVEMWYDVQADDALHSAQDLTRVTGRLNRPGRGGLVPLPASTAGMRSHVNNRDNTVKTTASTTSDDSLWFAAMAPSVLGAPAHDDQAADIGESTVDSDAKVDRGLVSSGSAASGMSGFTEAGYPPLQVLPKAHAVAASERNSMTSSARVRQARRVEWEHYAPLPLRRAVAVNATKETDEGPGTPEHAVPTADTHADTTGGSRIGLGVDDTDGSKVATEVKAVDGYALGTGWRPLASVTYTLETAPMPARESPATPPPPAPPAPPEPAPAPAVVLQERTARIADTAGAQTAVALQSLIDRETEIERLRERLHAAGSPAHAVEHAAKAHIASVPLWHASAAAAALTEPTPLKLLANILGKGPTPAVVQQPALTSAATRVPTPAVVQQPALTSAATSKPALTAADDEVRSAVATKLQAHERGRQARSRARAQLQHVHAQQVSELDEQREQVVAEIAAIVGEVLAKVDMHADRALAVAALSE